VVYQFGTVHAGDQYGEIRKALNRIVPTCGWKRVGYEGSFENIAPAYNAAEQFIPAEKTRQLMVSVFGEERLVDATDVIHHERARKTPFEIEKIRIANEIANIGLSDFNQKVDTSIRAIDIAASVEAAVMVGGTGHRNARRVRAFAQVAVGPETSLAWRPMEITSERRLRDSDIALLELAVVADGYWSDRTRARVAGRPTGLQREIWEIVEQSQQAAIEAVQPGSLSVVVDRAARNVIQDAGHGRDFMHITGHGLGFTYHEREPCICPGGSDVLRPCMVHTVEPGIYVEDIGGIRIEDAVLVTDEGSELLAPFSRNIV
jgi:Xaa-Pro aminopeptidase